MFRGTAISDLFGAVDWGSRRALLEVAIFAAETHTSHFCFRRLP